MAKNVRRIAELLGADVLGRLPETGGGAFGAALLARLVGDLQSDLQPGRGRRPGRPTDASWVHHPKVPMSEATRRKLALLAQQAGRSGRRVTPMQVAARLLEEALSGCQES
jgi:hypothetical protein